MTICNENFLSPTGFKLVVPGFTSIGFQCTSVNIPGISMGGPNQATPYNDFQLTGDKLTYEEFVVRFLIDEDCINYSLIHNWMVGITYPQKGSQWRDFVNEMKDKDFQVNDDFLDQTDLYLHILNSNYNTSFKVYFVDSFPVALTPMEFSTDQNDVQYLSAEIRFRYTFFKLTDRFDKPLTL
jgi:hypothetical protein